MSELQQDGRGRSEQLLGLGELTIRSDRKGDAHPAMTDGACTDDRSRSADEHALRLAGADISLPPAAATPSSNIAGGPSRPVDAKPDRDAVQRRASQAALAMAIRAMSSRERYRRLPPPAR